MPNERVKIAESIERAIANSDESAPAAWCAPSALRERFETDRLVLRFWEPHDAQGMLDAIEVDRASFLPWLPWVKADNRNLEECLAAIGRMQEKRSRVEPPADDFTIGIFEKGTELPLGGTGLHRIISAWHEAEIGYWVRRDWRSRGVCTEAVSGLLSWAFTPQDRGGWGLRRIHIRCAGNNLASQRVARKLGLREEGRLVGERWVEGSGWEDTLVWGVLKEEWNVDQSKVRHR